MQRERGSCCSDVWILGKGSVILKLFPQAKEVPYEDLGNSRSPGVFFTRLPVENQSYAVFRVSGQCPHLGEDLACKLGDKRPKFCKAFEENQAVKIASE